MSKQRAAELNVREQHLEYVDATVFGDTKRSYLLSKKVDRHTHVTVKGAHVDEDGDLVLDIYNFKTGCECGEPSPIFTSKGKNIVIRKENL